MPKVSIIVPVYNAEKYLNQCLDSLINQSLKDIEIICIDDGSTDSSGRIIDQYAHNDNRVIAIHQENHGQVYSNKVGLKHSAADYIGFTDADDWADPQMYEKLYKDISESDADIVKCGYYTETETSSAEIHPDFSAGIYNKEKMEIEIYPKMLGHGDFFTPGLSFSKWDTLYNKALLEKYLMIEDENIAICEDTAVTLPVVLSANRLYIRDDCLYHYRQYPYSMTKNLSDNKERSRFQALNKNVRSYFENNGDKYNLEEKWNQYLLYIMIPRADYLYEGFGELPYLFPYPTVKKGSDIILYCAGTYGQRLYGYLMKSHFCNVIAWVDRNAEELKKQGLPVISPAEIKKYQCDQIVVASSFGKQRKIICENLMDQYPDHKVIAMDTDLVMSENTRKKFKI